MKLLLQIFRILTFTASAEQLSNFGYKHLAAGLLCTWIVGMGRYWDDSCAYPSQHLGLASVGYVFLLAFLLWLVILPLKPAKWSYRQVLTYITLTSPPAIIYAIPVEHFLSMKDATNANLYFLIIVALWRVVLMAQYLRLVARLPFFQRFVGMLFPVSTVITLLFLFDQHRAVFEVMGGFRHHLNPREEADIFLNKTVGCAAAACPPAALFYVIMILHAHRKALSKFARRHKIAVPALSACVIAGIAYGIFRLNCKSPSDLLCEKAHSVDFEDSQKAIKLFDEAIIADSNNAQAYHDRGAVKERKAQYAEALEDYSHAIALNANDSWNLYTRASLLNQLGRPAEALVDMDKEKHLEATTELMGAASHSFSEKPLLCLCRMFQTLTDSKPWSFKQYAVYGEFEDLAWLKMPHGSIDQTESRTVIQEMPILWKLRRLSEALTECNRLVKLAEYAHGSAPASVQADKYVEDARLAAAYRMRGYTYELLSQNEKALNEYDKALSVVSDDQQALYLKARLLEHEGRHSEARTTFLQCKAATSHFEIGNAPSYIEPLTLDALGYREEAANRLMTDPKAKDAKPSSPAEKSHAGPAWEGFFTGDCSEGSALWETGKFFELLDMNGKARAKYLAAIKWLDHQKPNTDNEMNFLLCRARTLRSLHDMEGASRALQKARALGYCGEIPADDLESVDANVLVMQQFVPPSEMQ